MLTVNGLSDYIMNGLPSDHVEALGDDGQHFEAVIVSQQFTGKNKAQQHQLVHSALGDRMRGGIHALAMRTFTPDAWAESDIN
jgi:acid stress-induced BolA-like protein IbaG/YrbA